MTDLTTDAGVAAVRARLRGESDRLTSSDLDAIERRFAEGRVVNIAAQHQLLAEVRRLQSADEQVRALHHPVEIEPSETICGECSYRMPNGRYLPVVEHPCPTIDALDGGE